MAGFSFMQPGCRFTSDLDQHDALHGRFEYDDDDFNWDDIEEQAEEKEQ